MKHLTFTFTSLLFLLLVATSELHAHKVRVFAYEENGEIISEAMFNSGRPAKNSTVTVEKNDGTVLLSGATDDKGVYRFQPPEEARENELDLMITVDLGEGHKGSWLLKASDYLGTPTKQDRPSISSTPPLHNLSADHSNECFDLEKRLEEKIESELAPIKRMLAENSEHKTSLQDILGGIGYILGLAGLAAYIRYKKSGDTL